MGIQLSSNKPDVKEIYKNVNNATLLTRFCFKENTIFLIFKMSVMLACNKCITVLINELINKYLFKNIMGS